MSTIWRPVLLNEDPIVVKEEPDDDHHQPPAVNVEPPADDHEEDEKSEDLAGKMLDDLATASTGCTPASPRWRDLSEEEEKHATKKGVKRKRAPPRRGHASTG